MGNLLDTGKLERSLKLGKFNATGDVVPIVIQISNKDIGFWFIAPWILVYCSGFIVLCNLQLMKTKSARPIITEVIFSLRVTNTKDKGTRPSLIVDTLNHFQIESIFSVR